MKYEFNEKIDEKQLKWQQIGNEVENTIDKKGLALDENIKFAVISLKANNFYTTGSCEGHLDWGDPWPWVDIESSLAERLGRDQQYLELFNKSRIFRKGGDTMSEEEKQELEVLITDQKKENEKEYQRLVGLLKEFYTLQSEQNNENLNDNSSLGIWKRPWNQSRLKPNEAPNIISQQESQKLWPDEEKKKRLILYRQEMDKFAEFLKNKFFDKK